MVKKKGRLKFFIFGILFGIILTLGSIVYGGYWAYKNLSINKAEQISGQNFSFLDDVLAADSEIRAFTISDVITKVSAIPNQTFNQFATEYKITFPEEIAFLTEALNDVKIGQVGSAVNILMDRVKIGDIIGTPYNDFDTYPVDYSGAMPEGIDSMLWEFRTYTISGTNGISTFADTLTVGKLKNILGFTLPEMLSSISDEILISNLGSAIDNMAIRDLFDAPDVNDTSISAVILNRIRNMQINDSGTDRYYKLSEFSDLFSALSKSIYVRDIIPAPAAGDISSNASIINAIRDMKLVNPVTLAEDYYTIDNADGLFSALTANIYIRDLISAPAVGDTSSSASIIRAIRDMTKTVSGEEVYYSVDDSDALFANITNEIYVKDFIPAQAGTTATATIVNELRTKINSATGELYKLSEADVLFAGIGNDIQISEIIPEPSAGSSFVTTNLINKIRTMTDINGDLYTINNIGSLFEGIAGKLTIKDIMSEPLDTTTVSGKIMHKIWNTNATIDNISTEITNLITALTIQDIMTAPVDDGSVTYTIMNRIYQSNATIDNISDEISGIISALTIQDIMNEPVDTTTVSGKIMHDIWATNSNFDDLNTNISGVISALTLKDLITEPTNITTVSDKIMYKLWASDAPINNMDTAISGVMDSLELRDVLIPTGDTSSMSYKMITKLISPKTDTTYYKLNEIGSAINELNISDVFDCSTGIFAILTDYGTTNVPLNQIADYAYKLGNATMLELFNAGIIDTLPTNPAFQNMSLDDFINYINGLPI